MDPTEARRLKCLRLAIQTFPKADPDELARAAGRFERYVRDGNEYRVEVASEGPAAGMSVIPCNFPQGRAS